MYDYFTVDLYSVNKKHTECAKEKCLMINNKTTAVRLVPVPGKKVGDRVEFGGLLGYAPIIPVNGFSPKEFIERGGRIPAPVRSLTN